MKSVNGLRIFNATPHPITFWNGDTLFEVPADEVISASPVEETVDFTPFNSADGGGIQFVATRFVVDERGQEVIARAKAAGANLIVGSIIAAQAYPGEIVAMVPCAGFERVPPDQKRMRVDKFTVF